MLQERVLHRTSSVGWRVQGLGLILLTFMSFFPGWSHVAEILFVGLLVFACAFAWMDGESIWVRTPIDLPMILFVGWVLVSIPFATDPIYSLAEWRKLVTKVGAFYWTLLVLSHERDNATTRGVILAVAAGAAVISIYGLADFLLSGGSWRDRHVRAAAPSSDYNWLSTYLVIAIPLVAAAAISAGEQWQRVAYGTVLGLAFLGQASSYTRAGWLGLVVEICAFGWLMGRRKLAVGLLTACLAVGGGFWAMSKAGYQKITVSPETWEYRVAIWQKGVHEIMAKPVFGYGYGNLTFTRRSGELPDKEGPGLHSLFLMVAHGSGVPALLFLLWIFGASVASLLLAAAAEVERTRAVLLIAVGAMILGFAARNVFDYMLAGSLAYLFWILIATGLKGGAVACSASIPDGAGAPICAR